MYNFNINTAGFVIAGMFVVTWALAFPSGLRPATGATAAVGSNVGWFGGMLVGAATSSKGAHACPRPSW